MLYFYTFMVRGNINNLEKIGKIVKGAFLKQQQKISEVNVMSIGDRLIIHLILKPTLCRMLGGILHNTQ